MTLGDLRKFTVAVWGEESPQTKFVDSKMEQSFKGEDEEVIADESQILGLLATIGDKQ